MRRLVAIVAVLVACGGARSFHLSGADNDPAQLAAALSRRQLDAHPAPIARDGEPRAFVVVAGPKPQLVAYELARARTSWQVAANVTSRVWIGGDFVLAREGGELVARAQRDGAVRWKLALAGELIGATADRERAYVAWHAGKTAYLAAYDGATGARRWKLDADGQLGAPAAHGGVVYVPYFAQWLSIVDGATGAQLARLRGEGDEISIVRATTAGGYFGSKRGVRAFVERDVRRAPIPAQLERASYGVDAYDPIELGYTAADRARVLLGANAGYAIHYFRYLFGFADDGALAWAYAQPRVELVASAHAGNAIVAIAQTGEIVALDPATGAVRARDRLAITGTVVGAAFDADGWTPAGAPGGESVAAVLGGIARDRDLRFERVKELAVQSLARVPGADATTALLGVLADPRASAHLKDVAAESLAARRDPAGLPALVAQLAVETDYLANTEPIALGATARAIGALAGTLAPADLAAATHALVVHLDAPTTPVGDLVRVIDALGALGGGEEPALAAHLLMYRSDELADDAGWCKAIAGAIAARNGPGGRVVLEHVAADPRTRPPLVTAIHSVLGRGGN